MNRIINFDINLSTFFSLKDKKISVEKAYTEGLYSDTPANRKLGRVGMSYADWDNKTGKGEVKEKIDNISLYRLGKVLNESSIYPMSVKDHKEYFLISLEENDFKDKKKLDKTKEILEKLGAKVYVSNTTHFLKAFKKDNAVQEEEQDFFEIGNLNFDVNSRTLTHEDGTKTKLTPKEAELLKVFASNPNQFVSKDGLLEKVWGDSNYYNSRSMDVYITKLREKLAADKNINLMTIHWKGFKLIVSKNEVKPVVEKEEIIKEDTKKEESKEKVESNKTVLKKINDYFKFEDEEGSWFASTPIALIMSNDKEFGEIISKFTNYKISKKSGNYKNDGSRSTMLNCNVEYELTPKTAKKGEQIKKSFTINNKTTIKNILEKLGNEKVSDKPKENNKKLNKTEIKSILDEKFPFHDNSGTSWKDTTIKGSARSNYYQTNINGKDYYSLRSGRGVYFYLTKEDAQNNKECTKEDIIKNSKAK